MAHAQQTLLYVGTYASSKDDGIYLYTFDPEHGTATLVGGISGIENPSFLTIDQQQRYLYAVSETAVFQDQQGGSVAAFAIDAQDGTLTWLNQQPTLGNAPCFVSLDHSGSCLLVANYFGGNINLFPLQANGEIAEMAENIQRSGKGAGVNPTRQDTPHPHSIQVDPGGRPYVFVPDLGLDTIFVFRLDARAHRLTPYREIKTEPGAGPRHLAFHPTGNYLYVINELASTITAFTYHAEQADLRSIQTISMLPPDFQGENTSADIHISASGKYLYGSNRGDDSIVVFRIQPESGQLTLVQRITSGGKTPRNFALSPNGRYLLVANQDSHSIITYAVDQATGRLNPTGNHLEVPRPVCVQFMVRA